MIVIVIGLGSMGKRRIRLLRKISQEFTIVGVDTQRERCEDAKREFDIDTVTCLEDVWSQYREIDAAIISTSPLSHATIIHKCLEHGVHVFTELNLIADAYGENIALAKQQGKTLFLSSTFLYRDETNYISERTKGAEEKLNYIYHIGQYLPDWHPWEYYNNYFVGDKRTNGCREIMAIELPWLIEAFGDIDKITVMADKATELSIEYKDNYFIQIQHKTGHKGMLAVDVMTRKAERRFEVYGENLYLSWDGTPDTLKEYSIEEKKEKNVELYHDVERMEGYAAYVVENAYENELRAFLDVISGKATQKYTFEQDINTLNWIDRIESYE